MEFKHVPIMLNECIENLAIKPDGIYVDCTLGGAGHSKEIAKCLNKKGMLIGIDRDTEALAVAKERLKEFECQIKLVHSNYNELKEVLESLNLDKVDGVLADLGVSSYQLDNGERGFSYRFDAPLDMRMNKDDIKTAKDVVNEYELNDLTRVIREYGEEKYAYQIAKNIIKIRAEKEINTTFELVDIILNSMPKKVSVKGRSKAGKTFQAIRIEVNRELELLKNSVNSFFDCLKPGGRLAIITFHSLEDRIVKNCFNDFKTGCICPKELPVCVCHNEPKGKIITRKPLVANEEELLSNSRASSAKLRVVEKL